MLHKEQVKKCYRDVKSLAKIVNLPFFDCVWGFTIEPNICMA